MATRDPRHEEPPLQLTLVEGGTPSAENKPTAEAEVLRWKTWVAVLLAVILLLVTMHMDGPKYLGAPDPGPSLPSARSGR